jgi:signal transduction histidine kinase
LLAFDAAATVIAVVLPAVSFAGLLSAVVEDRAVVLAVPLVLIPTSLALIGTFAVAMVAIGHSELARLLLAAGEEETVRMLTRSRARLIDGFEVERRRIERDLHDGAQQRLVALTMTLGLAELEHGDPDRVRSLVSEAGEQARRALAELRDLIRGIYPRVLTDLGLPAAVAELAQGCGTPLSIAVHIPERLPSTVESAAYFVVAEAVSNAVKHATPNHIWVTGGVDAGRLVIEVRDDGGGGADPAAGTGLSGLADRVDALDGTLTITSPPGGPTVLRLDLPGTG